MAPLPRSARLLRALVVVTCLVPLVQACGGRSDTEDYLFGSDGTITTGASTGTAGRGSTGGGTRPSNGGASATGGRSGGGASGPIGFGGVTTSGGGGPIPQAGAPATGGVVGVGGAGIGGTGTSVGGAGVAGAGGAAIVTPIVCGAQVCNGVMQSCCAGLSGLGCIRKNQACDGAVLGCTVNADCAGVGVCCISITGDVAEASSCKARCDNTGNGRDRQLCQTDDECAPPFHYCTATIFGVNICTRRP